jgi:hypothetical protein
MTTNAEAGPIGWNCSAASLSDSRMIAVAWRRTIARQSVWSVSSSWSISTSIVTLSASSIRLDMVAATAPAVRIASASAERGKYPMVAR